MPPRRRGNAATARAAAIQAVQRKRSDHEEQHEDEDEEGEEEYCDKMDTANNNNNNNNNNNHNHNSDHDPILHSSSERRKQGRKRSHDDDWIAKVPESEQEDDEDDDDDCPPPLVGNDEEFFEGHPGDDDDSANFVPETDSEGDGNEAEDDDNAVVLAEGNSSNTMSGEGGCLHCHKSASSSDIQVRCDECQAYICQNCHWCHEFQANHEIRVCDRCDAFYCRTCDEMDQCDDCGEVVCASCSTLLSCKFCGGGLCEECATACGRCGIVLCSRDAKFAVDCDTCRLSYCLVCLASGSKDPCVRCGHRPSKRMEQLVHLRLKSIYKAFKQSSRNAKYGNNNNNSSNGGIEGADAEDGDDDLAEEDDDDDDNTDAGKSGDPQSLLQAAASAASKRSSARANSRNHHHHSHHTHHHDVPSKRTSAAAATAASRDQQAKEMVEKYMAEKEKADAAAAALLAELEEEEQAEKSKKSKKKRKKERDRAKKEEDVKTDEPDFFKGHEHEHKHEDSDGDVDLGRDAPTVKKGPDESEKKRKKKKKKKGQSDEDKDDKAQSEDGGEEEEEKDESSDEIVAKPEPAEPEVDPVEQQLVEFVADEDIDGIEQILEALKGVPGRAALRKNAKKALKRLKTAQEEHEAEAAAAGEAKRAAEEQVARKREEDRVQKEHRSTSGAGTPATQSETNSSSIGVTPHRPPPPPLPPNELFRAVSISHNRPATLPGGASAQRTGRGHGNGAPALKSECVFHIAPAVVGWLIGKGGQRIRDVMEESGAKVWIDQEHMREHDPRIVYISGNRKNVESAERIVKNLLSKSPVTAPGASALAPNAAPTSPMETRVSDKLAFEHSTFASGAIGENKLLDNDAQGRHSSHDVDQDPADNNTTPLNTPRFNTSIIDDGSPKDDSRMALASGEREMNTAGIENYNEHEMTCEACFVPLLIGRRGWTIKHIQDSSGAKVDIDQAVTPRKIKISGRDENVQTAIRMVSDVLSYPHAQLQGVAESDGTGQPSGSLGARARQALGADLVAATVNSLEKLQIGESTGATQSNNTTVGASNQMLVPGMQASPTEPNHQSERTHTPPPSSTINIGDAKSTISASSSLSSTPEPSMASSAKGHYGVTGPTGPLLPPDFDGGGNFPQQQNMVNPDIYIQQSNVHLLNFGAMGDSDGHHGRILSQQHTAPPLFPGNIPSPSPLQDTTRYDLQPGPPRGFSQQQQLHQSHHQQLHQSHHVMHAQHQQQQSHTGDQQRAMLSGSSMLREQHPQHPQNFRSVNGPSRMPHQNFQPRSGQHPPRMHHSQSLQFASGMSSQQDATVEHQRSAFHPSSQKQSRHDSAPELAVGGMGHSAVQKMGAGGARQGHQGNLPPPGIWEERNSSSGVGSGSTNHRSSQGPRYQQNFAPMHECDGQNAGPTLSAGTPSLAELSNDFIGLPGASLNSGIDIGLPRGGNGQQSILASSGRDDSQMVDSLFGPPEAGNTPDKHLLPGFQGLPIAGGLNTDPWAKPSSSKEDFRESKQGSSALFAAIQPTLDAQEVYRPPTSRFGFNESQGQWS